MLSAGGASFTYDDDGYLRTKTVDGETTTYTYSSRGELLQVDLPDGTVVEYVHDPLGRRIAKKVNGAYTEHYLLAGMTTLLAVYDGSGVLKQRFEYVAGRLPVRMVEGGSSYHLIYDQVGTLRAVVDGSGNVVRNIEYDSFSNIIEDSDPSLSIPFRFAGGLWDADTGLVKLGARDYDPDVGRWTSKDPSGFNGGDTDLYGYCMSDPVSSFDPTGLNRYVFYDDDFSSQAKALEEHWKYVYPHEYAEAIPIESPGLLFLIFKFLANTCPEQSINELVFMFHGPIGDSDWKGKAITIGEDNDLGYIYSGNIPPNDYSIHVSDLPRLPLAESALIQINTCKGGIEVSGNNLGEEFNKVTGVETWAYSQDVNYPNPDRGLPIWRPTEHASTGGATTPNVYR